MKHEPVFVVKGRALKTAIIYAYLGFVLIGTLYLFLQWNIKNESSFQRLILIQILYIIILSFIAILYYYVYRALLTKKVIYDGYHLYFYSGKVLKMKMIFSDIHQIYCGRTMIIRRGSTHRMSIMYRDGGKKKIYRLPMDEFAEKDMINLFNLIARYADPDRLFIQDKNGWLYERRNRI